MNARLRILHVYQSGSFSGAEAYALEVAFHHAENQHVVFLTQAASPLLHKIETRPMGTAGSTNINSPDLQVATDIAKLDLSRFDFVILHSTQELKRHWLRLALAKLKARLQGRRSPKVIVYTHIWISHSKNDPLHAIPYAIVDRIWTSSAQSQAALRKYLPVPSEKVDVVRYGRDTDGFSQKLLSKTAAREKLRIPETATVVGTLARVDAGKGSRELFEAVTDLMQLKSDLHFLMIGPPTDGDPKATVLDDELNHAIERMPMAIRSRIHKIGRLEGGSYILKAFDLFVLATYKENFALTLLEALLAEVPCLATDSGGSPDVVRPHATGWLFLPGSTDSLRSTLLTALDEKEKWSEFGANGRKLVLENFNFKNVMKDLDRKLRALQS